MDRIQFFFKHNFKLKLISVFLAFATWLMVVNISNPEVKTSISSAIDVRNGAELIAKDKYYSLDTNSVRLTFNIRQNQRLDITSNDFDVYVDMGDYSITGALPVYFNVSERVKDAVSDVKVDPVVVHASLEDMAEKTFDMTIATQGEPVSGYAVGPVTFSPNRVKLYGPSSEIGRISRIGCTVDVSNASTSIWGNAEFEYYDANDNRFSPDVRIQVRNTVSYYVPILKKKTVSVTVQTTGNPSPGYNLDTVSCEPSFIEVYGEDKVLENVNAIILPDNLLNVSNAVSDVTASIDISEYLPDGIYSDTVGNIALVARITKGNAAPAPVVIPGAGAPPQAAPPAQTAAGPGAGSTTNTGTGAETVTGAGTGDAETGNGAGANAGSGSNEGAGTGAEAGASEGSASGSEHQTAEAAHSGDNAGDSGNGEGESAHSAGHSESVSSSESGAHESSGNGAHDAGSTANASSGNGTHESSGSGTHESEGTAHENGGRTEETTAHSENVVVSEAKSQEHAGN